MNLKILRARSLGRLKDNLITDFSRYTDPEDPIISEDDLIDSRIEVGEAPALIDTENDAENAGVVHSWLNKLDPVQASDERLWTALSLGEFRDYTIARWNPAKASTVKTRFFYAGTGLETAVRNAISRLWWFGHLTCEPDSTNPYELTGVLLSNQDIQQAFTERSIGRCRPLLHASLRYFSENREMIESLGTGNFAQAMAKEIRLQSGVRVVDALTDSQMQSLVERAGVIAKLKTARTAE